MCVFGWVNFAKLSCKNGSLLRESDGKMGVQNKMSASLQQTDRAMWDSGAGGI